MVTVVVLPLVETVAIIRRVNDITDGRLFVSVLVAALFVFLIWNSLYGHFLELYLCGIIAVCAVLFFVPSNLIKKSWLSRCGNWHWWNCYSGLQEWVVFGSLWHRCLLLFYLLLLLFSYLWPALLSNAELTASNVFRIWFSRLVENIPKLSFIILAIGAFYLVLIFVECAAIVKRVNDVTDCCLWISFAVAALFLISLYMWLFTLMLPFYVFVIIPSLLSFLPSNLIVNKRRHPTCFITLLMYPWSLICLQPSSLQRHSSGTVSSIL